MIDNRVPLEYLDDCSMEGLENFALKQMEIASLLRKSIRADLDRMVDALLNAEVAGLLINRGAELSEIASARQKVLLRFDEARERSRA